MAEESRFFDAEETSPGVFDRLYDTGDWAAVIRGLTFDQDGAVEGYGDALEVVPSDPEAMLVVLGTGMFFGDGRQYENTEALTFGISANTSGSTRVDRIILRLDLDARTFVSAKLEGTPGAGAPALTNTATVKEWGLAQVTVANGAGTIGDADIVNEAATLGVPLPRSGGVMTGPLFLDGDPTEPEHATTKQYVDAEVASVTFAAVDVQVFTASDTWTKPEGANGETAKAVEVILFGAGGGGGNGAGSTAGGGGGGGGGACTRMVFPASAIGSSVSVTVGAGGTAGSAGGATSFGTHAAAGGGGAGSAGNNNQTGGAGGGTAGSGSLSAGGPPYQGTQAQPTNPQGYVGGAGAWAASTGNSPGSYAEWGGGAGGHGRGGSSGSGNAGGKSARGGGGGGGGGLSNSGAQVGGAGGANDPTLSGNPPTGGGGAGGSGTAGSAGTSRSGTGRGGDGGGGGGTNASPNGLAGGAGGAPGGGGGGGGGSSTGAGTGGTGGRGEAIVITYF